MHVCQSRGQGPLGRERRAACCRGTKAEACWRPAGGGSHAADKFRFVSGGAAGYLRLPEPKSSTRKSVSMFGLGGGGCRCPRPSRKATLLLEVGVPCLLLQGSALAPVPWENNPQITTMTVLTCSSLYSSVTVTKIGKLGPSLPKWFQRQHFGIISRKLPSATCAIFSWDTGRREG